MAAKKLNQVLAVEKTVKSKRENELSEVYHAVQKAELTIGLSRTYQPKNDDGEQLPPEQRRVQVRIEEALKSITEGMREVFNITACKDATNCAAKADVTVDGEVLLKGVPATHLLWLEKKLVELSKFVNQLPTLSQDTVWQYDAGQGLFRSESVETVKTKKVEDFRVIVPPTKEHPARVEKVVEDQTVGWWKTTHLSGAIPDDRKKQLMARIEKFLKAVKEAREEANQTEVVDLATGIIVEKIFAP